MSNKFIQLPELVQHLSHYLNNPAVFICIQISRAWHTAFIPHLWHTIDDRSEVWIRLLTDLKSKRSRYNRDVAWYKEAIANNGQHIRHLDIWDTLTLEACLEATSCTGITHLTLCLDDPNSNSITKDKSVAASEDPESMTSDDPKSVTPENSRSVTSKDPKSVSSTDSPSPTPQLVFSFKPLLPSTPSTNTSDYDSSLQINSPTTSSASPPSSIFSIGSTSGSNPSTLTSPSASSFTIEVPSRPSETQSPFKFGSSFDRSTVVPTFSFDASVKPALLENNSWQRFVVDVPPSVFRGYKTAPESRLKSARYFWQLVLRNKNLQEIRTYKSSAIVILNSAPFLRSTLRGLTQLKRLYFLFTDFDYLDELPDIAPGLEKIADGMDTDYCQYITRPHPNLKSLTRVTSTSPKQLAVAFDQYPRLEEIRLHMISITNENPIHFNSQHLKIWQSSNPAVLLTKHITFDTRHLTELRFTDVLGISQLLQLIIKFPHLETFKTTNLIRDEKLAADTALETEELIATFRNLGIVKPTAQTARSFSLKNLTIGNVTGLVNKDFDPLEPLWPCVPLLKSLALQPFPRQTFSNLVTHCPQLQNLQANLEHPCSKEISKLLATCSELVSFTGDRHTVNAYDIIGNRWVCNKLERLDLEIIGVRREIEDELTGCIIYHNRLHYSRLSEKDQPPQGKDQLSQWKKEQVDSVYQQLGLLTQLKELKLGAWTIPYGVPEYGATMEEKKRIARTDVYLPDSLEMTMDYGLQLLAPLKRLERLDVKGMNHRMTEQDLDWLLRNCPRLLRVRGLKGGFVSKTCPHDDRKYHLAEYLKEHHPYVELLL
ncbi:hypothetical protein BG003_002548 [Podila horticola]|nr:hypothetical protein BG003_002548 [Podila horticola]